ncbi:Signal transduction histidine kinase [Salegentibacter agarivorans]|uniref:histidine kinase n=1 Tax=Salegentibacter agarivorans TaxID=345907 RepID=A0A1I2KML0_9FLAO|nr:hybrid sensor histidine kinase/response regulator transcription factor [Salegentibacter agarivorans]SFF68214.1 Signal transduction histidine kinase [Salegentibacter agarivorans]
MRKFWFLKYSLVIINLLFTGSLLLFAQEAQISFERITTNDGLSQSDINSIYQDQAGFMWFGTHDGLNKFDGYNIEVYKPQTQISHSISSNLVFAITGDEKGNLWIGTTGGGLNFYNSNTKQFTTFKHEENNPKSLISNHVNNVFLDSRNKLWIGTNKGLNMLDLNDPKEEWDFLKITLSGNNASDRIPINTIFEDNCGNIWVGKQNELFRSNNQKEVSPHFAKVNKKLGLLNYNIQAIAEDKLGNLFFATTQGLYFSRNNSGHLEKSQFVHPGSFNDIKVDNQNQIWGGTDQGLIYIDNSGNFPKFSQKFVYDPININSISKNIIKSIFIDNTGIIWIGTNGGGINKYNPARKRFQHIRKTIDTTSLSYDKIRSIFEDSNQNLWIGTEGGGLNLLTENETDINHYSTFKKFSSVLKIFVLTELQLKNKRWLIIGAEGTPGLYKLDITNPKKLKEKAIIPIPNVPSSVFSLLTDSGGNLWIGTYNQGVHRWLNKGDSLQKFEKNNFTYDSNSQNSIGHNIIRSIYEDSKGNMWFATGNGLSRLSPDQVWKKNPRFINYRHKDADTSTISHNYILSLHESKQGDIWIGTFGGGLNKYVPQSQTGPEHFVRYTEKDGLSNNVIKGILEDSLGNLWLSTNNGLSKFDPEKETFRNYSVYDGLQNNEFQELAYLKRYDGEMLFGGINGFNAFYPDEIQDNLIPPETVITNFSISNNPVEVGEKINGKTILEKSILNKNKVELKYFQNNVSFEFAALHYASPKKNNFAYLLEGLQDDWIHTTSDNRIATYTNLSPGNYTLKVKSSNNDGIWDPTPTMLNIEITPPFWKTTAAYIFYSLCILAFLIGLWKYTIISTTKKHDLEIEHLEKEKNEEVQQMKLDFFTNISHEFRTPLTLIKGPLEYLQQKGRELDYNIVEHQYALMYKNTKYLLRLVTQLLDFQKIDKGKMQLNLRKGNIVRFIEEVGEPFKFISEKKNINYKINAEERKIYSYFDPDALEKILNNLLSNAFKFCPQGGYIIVNIKREFSSSKKDQNSKQASEEILIEITDSGAGISAAKKERIFKRFYSQNSPSQANVGTGIGLSYTKSLVDLHLGTIDIANEKDARSTFIVTLPKNKIAYLNKPGINISEDSSKEIILNPSNSSSYLVSLNDEKNDEDISKDRAEFPVILVVDDNKDIRTFIKQSLKDQYNIHEAQNGKEGFEKAKAIVPNIIISDLIMPEIDGIEFCKKCKNMQETSHIPFLLLTAKDSKESELIALESGADDYLLKPFNLELLQLKLKNIITRRNLLRKRFNREIILKPEDVTVTSADEKFLEEAMAIVEKNMMNTDFSVEMMVKEMGLSRSNLYLKLKEITGLSSSEFIRNIRLKRAVQLLEQSDLSVKEIMYMTGFNTASYFAKCFKKQFGKTPSEYVNKNPSA